MFMLSAAIGSGAVASPMLANEQTNLFDGTRVHQSEPKNGNEEPGGKKTGLLKESEEEKNMTTEQKLAFYAEQKTIIYADILVLQTQLDELNTTDVTNFTEEELALHQEQIASLEAQILELQDLLHSYEVRERIMLGKQAREYFKNQQGTEQSTIDDSWKDKIQDRLMLIYEKKEQATQRLLNRIMEQTTLIDEQLTLLTAELNALYEIDTTNFTEEELALHQEQIALLEQQIIELNEELLAKQNQYQHSKQIKEKVQAGMLNRINEIQNGVQKTNRRNKLVKFAEIN